MRLFVCCELGEDCRSRLWDLSLKLQAPGASVAWVARANYHLTLKFLGEVAEDRVDQVINQLRSVNAGRSAFDLHLQGAGAFPHPGAPRVLWVGVERGGADVCSLQRLVDQALAGVGFTHDVRSFHAHVTIGRVREPPKAARLLRRVLEACRELEVGQTEITRLTLMCSDLAPQGARYTALERFPLTG